MHVTCRRDLRNFEEPVRSALAVITHFIHHVVVADMHGSVSVSSDRVSEVVIVFAYLRYRYARIVSFHFELKIIELILIRLGIEKVHQTVYIVLCSVDDVGGNSPYGYVSHDYLSFLSFETTCRSSPSKYVHSGSILEKSSGCS